MASSLESAGSTSSMERHRFKPSVSAVLRTRVPPICSIASEMATATRLTDMHEPER